MALSFQIFAPWPATLWNTYKKPMQPNHPFPSLILSPKTLGTSLRPWLPPRGGIPLVMAGLMLLLSSLHPFPAAAQDGTGVVCVTAPRAVLVEGPGVNYTQTWVVVRHTPLQWMGTQGEWVKVRDVDGDIHWIVGAMVDEKSKCVMVSQDFADVRDQSGGKGKLIYTATRYTVFHKIGEQADWTEVEHEGQHMWVKTDRLWP